MMEIEMMFLFNEALRDTCYTEIEISQTVSRGKGPECNSWCMIFIMFDISFLICEAKRMIW